MDNLKKFEPPSDEVVKKVFTTFSSSNDTICQSLHAMKWTDWNSACNATNGSDFEILADHQAYFG